MQGIRISKVESDSDRLDFIRFPWKVYRGDRYWVPPLISERKQFTDPQKSPFFEHAHADFFTARRKGEIIGTIGAFSNQLYNEFQGVNACWFGFFEVLEDPEVAAALLRTAEDWARQQGHDHLLGPAQYSTNDEIGLLVDGFDDVPRILMTYNPRRYQGYLEGDGYQKAMDLWAYSVDVRELVQNMPEKITRVTEKIRKRWNLTLRPVEMKYFDRDVGHIKRLYNASWERNWGFVPMTDRELDHMAKSLKPLVDPDLAVMVEKDGEVVGFGIALPDLNQPLHDAYPRPGTPEPLTMLKFLWNWKVLKRVDWIRAWALGVLPEYRGQGFDSLMYLELARASVRKGYKWAEMSWILENNTMVNRAIALLGGKVYKTYRVYQKQL
jgi:GNAT superfamily N-acetyltransferase